jgi:alanyl-tRNA synthetase
VEPGASAETRSEVEEIANNAVRDNLEVTTRILPIAEAKAAGAMALFGEKYGDTVRMVDIGGPLVARAVRRHPRPARRPRSGW